MKSNTNKRLLHVMNEKLKRKRDLEKLMRKYKLKIRSDSKLCNGFINGSIVGISVEYVVHRMCEMKYLYDYANINDAFNDAQIELKNNSENLSGSKSLFDIAERIALEKCGGYPETFPWMKRVKTNKI